MKLVSAILGLTLASALAIASANAADMYVPAPAGGYKDGPAPVALWNGAYVGIDGGYGWGNSKLSCDLLNYCDRLGIKASKSFATDGGFGGGQIGYNWRPLGGGYKDGEASGNFVFGIEADIQGANITGTGTFSNKYGSASRSYSPAT